VLKSVVLQTSARNLAAINFYEMCGYKRQALKVGYYGGVFVLRRSLLISGKGCDTYATFSGRWGKRCHGWIGRCQPSTVREDLGGCILGVVH